MLGKVNFYFTNYTISVSQKSMGTFEKFEPTVKNVNTLLTWLFFHTFYNFLLSHFSSNILFCVHLLCFQRSFVTDSFLSVLLQTLYTFENTYILSCLFLLCWHNILDQTYILWKLSQSYIQWLKFHWFKQYKLRTITPYIPTH